MQVFTELNVQSSFGILVMYLGRMNDSCLILYFVAPVVDQTGCSDCDLVENCSEFSSTPNTSTHTTPEPSPIKKRRVEEPQPLTLEGTQPLISGQKKSKGKDLSLLMAGQTVKCMVPKDSLYFREQNNMARTKRRHVKVPGNVHETSWLQTFLERLCLGNKPGKMRQRLWRQRRRTSVTLPG